MKKILIASGFITVGLFLLYVVIYTGHEEMPSYLQYAMAFFASVFTALLVYYLLQRVKKKR